MNIQNTLKIVSIGIFVLVCVVFVMMPATQKAYATECFEGIINENTKKSLLERILAQCQEAIEKNEEKLRTQQADRTNTEYDILLIDQEINKAIVRIRSSDSIIGQLGEEITTKEGRVGVLSKDLEEHIIFLGTILQKINEEEQKGLVNFILSGATFSSFFSRTDEYRSLRETIEDSINEIDTLKVRIVASVDELEDDRVEQGRIRQQQRLAADQVEDQRKQKERVLNYQLGVERKTQKEIDLDASRAAEIRNRLFELRGTKGIPFGEALALAQEVEKKTGVRPAFLLGIIKNESDLGKHVGSGTYLTAMHPTRDQPIFPYITELLGFSNPEKVPVSANPGFGWGGAMGPAQFIPSTWVCYGGLINSKTRTCAITSDKVIRGKQNLQIGSTGGDVQRLQKFLNDNGFTIARSGPGSSGKETRIYTDDVARAVTKFQEKYASRILKPYGYTRGTGTVGPSTISAINQLNFYSGPWHYDEDKDRVRNIASNNRPSNPWIPRDAFFASATYLSELMRSAKKRVPSQDAECVASRAYYAGWGNYNSRVAKNYCEAILANARIFQQEINFLGKGS